MASSVRRLHPVIRSGMLIIVIMLLSWLAWPLVQERLGVQTQALGELSDYNPSTGLGAPIPDTPTPSPSPTLEPISLFSPETITLSDGVLVLSIRQGKYSHLFAYHPNALPLTRITYGDWDDESPAINLAGTHLAFSSNRDGQWDIYIMHLPTGEVTRLTETLEYDGKPSWSPDGLWLAHDTYLDDSLEIMIRPIDASQAPIRLTNGLASDFAPAWSPHGRQIAFVSTRSGENEIWLADLDNIEDRFTNLSRSTNRTENRPVWSPDGSRLLWSAMENGSHGIYIWEMDQPREPARYLGIGDWATWSPDAEQVVVRLNLPNQTYLTAYGLDQASLFLPPFPIHGELHGLGWGNIQLPDPPPAAFIEAAQFRNTPLWEPFLSDGTDVPNGRARLSSIGDVSAPYAVLNDGVDESFKALRNDLAERIGWDFLGSLENAYVPLTSPAQPSMEGSWLYTGRGIAFNTVPMSAGWLVAVQETFGEQTFWRIFLRTRLQDGTQGKPMSDRPWSFSARYTGDPKGYEQGGLPAANPPSGYWVDFTEFALAYGWERMPAASTWRSFYPAARVNEFAFTQGMDWRSAILEIYPPEMLITPTPVSSPTITHTPTVTSTRTPWPTRTPRPTSTPWPTRTSTPTQTPTITLTPTITPTVTNTPQGR